MVWCNDKIGKYNMIGIDKRGGWTDGVIKSKT